ncbi:MAG: acyl-CoA dehydrogenase family protein, partial [Ilumatobacter sp.]
VVRTDPQAVKHAGLPAFVVDMEDPTVDVRPLRQMTGEAEFNAVFFSDTKIHESEMLGSPGDGWRVSLTTLMNERQSIGGGMPARGSGPIGDLTRAWADAPDHLRTASARDRVMQLWCQAEVLRLTNIRANQNRKMGDPGPEGSIGKMAGATLNIAVQNAVMDMMGTEALLYGSYEMYRPETAQATDTAQKAFLRSRANTIEGGTTEVMANILGERVLGLPGDVRVDRGVPWNEVPRN